MSAISTPELLELRIGDLLDRYPFVSSFFTDEGLDFADEIDWSLARCLDHHATTHPDLDRGWGRGLAERLARYVEEMLDFVEEEVERIESVTILGGTGKDGSPEPVGELTFRIGDVAAIVGPTGSGKSRLLADLEWVAQADTPTGRRVLLNGGVPDRKWRFSTEHKLVAQLSQNMNFVMDLGVADFLRLHAESRRVSNPDEMIARIWDAANALAGEPFELDTPVTSLSGGQSRALMIADTAVLSRSPVVLIDEIENAGIDRRRALDLLVREEKIVLMATHDPILALYGKRRIVLKNGAMRAVITPTEKELANVEELRAIDARLMSLRNRLRGGELLETL